MARDRNFAAAGLATMVALVMPGLATANGPVPTTVVAPAETVGSMQASSQPMSMAATSHIAAPTMSTEQGQAAFAALQEIVRILEADPHTDWSKVNLDALREHLIDMSRVTLDAHAIVHRIPGGTRITVTGAGRTLAAIQRLLPQEAMHLNGMHGWQIAATRQPHDVVLTVTTGDPHGVAEIRALGFAGILASGDFHPMHHLEIARGNR